MLQYLSQQLVTSNFSYNNYVMFFYKNEDISGILQQAYQHNEQKPILKNSLLNISYSLNSISQLTMLGINNSQKVIIYDRNYHFLITNIYTEADIPVFEIQQRDHVLRFLNVYNSIGFLLYVSIFHPLM